ncbi:MAG: ArsR/SmtB family transcription factor [Bacillota bacterium]
MREVMAITNALADESRVRALMSLRHGELCVCQIVELLQLAPSTVSKHMSILRDASLVEGRKEGRWMYYILCDKPDSPAGRAVAWVQSTLEADERIKADDKRLKAILKESKEDLCRRQMGRSECC